MRTYFCAFAQIILSVPKCQYRSYGAFSAKIDTSTLKYNFSKKKKNIFFKKNEFERKLMQAKISANKVKHFVLFLFRNSMRLTQNISDFCGLFQ